MTPEELKRQEDNARPLLDALAHLSRSAQAPPDFVATVMRRAEQLPPLPMGWGSWLRTWLQWPMAPSLRVVTVALLLLALVGAIPQYSAWLQAYRLDVPSTAIHEAQLQERLWHKNFACATRLDQSSPNYAALTGERVMVVVWACPSGDVLVTLGSPDEPARERYVWVELGGRQNLHSSLLSMVSPAFAAEGRPEAPFLIAQAARVLCQSWLPNGLIKRRVQLANGQCQDEIINSRDGRVIERRSAPCDPSC